MIAATPATLDELRELPESLDGPAVYFLWRNDELVYIGASRNIVPRIRWHERAMRSHPSCWYQVRVQFDRVTMFACKPAKLFEVESAYINRFRPSSNKRMKPCPSDDPNAQRTENE